MNARVARKLRQQAHNAWAVSKYKDTLTPREFYKAIKKTFYRQNKD